MNTSSRTIFGLLSAALLVSGGCGEVAFKTGANADALKADQLQCRRDPGGAVAYKACMSRKGWTIPGLDDDAAPDATQPTAISAPGFPAPMAPAPVATDAPVAPAQTGMPAVPMREAAPAPAGSRPVKVTGWIKFGGGDPKDAITACVARLGPAEAPDAAHETVTAALLSCMHAEGWHGL